MSLGLSFSMGMGVMPVSPRPDWPSAEDPRAALTRVWVREMSSRVQTQSNALTEGMITARVWTVIDESASVMQAYIAPAPPRLCPIARIEEPTRERIIATA